MHARRYVDFRVEMTRLSGTAAELRVTSTAGETSAPVKITFDDRILTSLLDDAGRLAAKQMPSDDLLAYGQHLARYLMPPVVRELLTRAIAEAGDDEGVRLRLVFHDDELACLPWEFVHFNRGGTTRLSPYLALDERISVVRHETQSAPLPTVRPLHDGYLRVVVAGAKVVPGAVDLAGDDDFAAIKAALSSAVDGINVQLRFIGDPATPTSLRDALSTPADVFQFVGHGLDPSIDVSSGLILASDDGRGEEVLHPADLAELLKQADVRIAVLVACHSASRSPARAWSSVASELVRSGVPAVVAMQHAVESSHAVVFQEGLYRGIASGHSLDEAVAAGRRAITGHGVLAEWGVPVLYTRSDGVLFGGSEVRSAVEVTDDPLDLSSAQELEWTGDWGRAVDAYLRLLPQASLPWEEARIRLRIGACLWQDGDPAESEEYLAKAKELAIQLGDHHLLGDVLFEDGRRRTYGKDFDKAKDAFEAAYEAYGPDAAADRQLVQVRLAFIECEENSTRSALARLESPELEPETMIDDVRADYYDVLGEVYQRRGQFELAIGALETALDLDERVHPEYEASATRLRLAKAHLGRGDREAALTQVKLALDAYAEAEDEVGLADAYLMKGQILEDASDYQGALRAYSRASNYDAAVNDVAGQARAYRLLGSAALKKGDNEAAEEYFAQARALLFHSKDDVERAALLVEEAYLLIEIGEIQDAIEKLEDVLAIAEADEDERAVAIAKRHLAAAKRERGDLPDAIELLHNARLTLEERGDARELEVLLDDLGEVLIECGRYAESIEILEQSQKLDEELMTGRGRGRSLLLLGQANSQLGRRARARADFEQALEVYRSLRDTVGESDALCELGQWYADDGKYRTAVSMLTQALRIDRVQEDRIGIVRCHRALASCFRRTGNWARAEDDLANAIAELGNIPDRLERSLVKIEEAELALARGDYRDAIEHTTAAKKVLLGSEMHVQEAICDRLTARACAGLGDYGRAIALLDHAVELFEERQMMIELNHAFDDLAEVHLLAGDLPSARRAIERSLTLDEESQWWSSQGRSYMLLGDIEQEAGNAQAAFGRYGDALRSYEDATNEVGQAQVQLRLGAWHVQHAEGQGGEIEQAVRHLKNARRLFQAHHDLRGMSRAFRRLGDIYFAREQFERAGEAYEQAEDCLEALRSDREMAPLALAQARLLMARKQHRLALPSLKTALELYRSLQREDKVHEVLRQMALAHQNLHEVDEALDCIRQIGLEQARIWRVMLENLHPEISEVSSSAYRDGAFDVAVRRALGPLHGWVIQQERSATAPAPIIDLGRALLAAVELPEANSLWARSSLDAIAAIACAHVVLQLAEASPPVEGLVGEF